MGHSSSKLPKIVDQRCSEELQMIDTLTVGPPLGSFCGASGHWGLCTVRGISGWGVCTCCWRQPNAGLGSESWWGGDHIWSSHTLCGFRSLFSRYTDVFCRYHWCDFASCAQCPRIQVGAIDERRESAEGFEVMHGLSVRWSMGSEGYTWCILRIMSPKPTDSWRCNWGALTVRRACVRTPTWSASTSCAPSQWFGSVISEAYRRIWVMVGGNKEGPHDLFSIIARERRIKEVLSRCGWTLKSPPTAKLWCGNSLVGPQMIGCGNKSRFCALRGLYKSVFCGSQVVIGGRPWKVQLQAEIIVPHYYARHCLFLLCRRSSRYHQEVERALLD